MWLESIRFNPPELFLYLFFTVVLWLLKTIHKTLRMKTQTVLRASQKQMGIMSPRASKRAYTRHARWVAVIAFCLTTLVAFMMSGCESSENDGPATVPGNIETVAGIGGSFDNAGDGGEAIQAQLGYVTGIAVDNAGDVYVTDGAANVIRKVTRADGKISTIAGTFLGFNAADPTPHAGDGSTATAAHLNVPFGVAIAPNNDVYIADAGNHVIRRIDATTGKIVVFAGSYSQPLGYAGDGGAATNAALYTPHDIAIDQEGNVFIADKDNHVIRRVAAATGIISTVAGSGPSKKGYAGDNGPATSARLNTPQGIAVASNGDLYIADAANNVIRRVDASTGNISTFAGTGSAGLSGDNGPATSAQLYAPTRIALDEAGNVYVSDHGNHVIRQIDPAGTITTIAGTGTPGFSGDGGLAVNAQLSSPFGIAIDAEGNLLFTDNGNSVVRAIIR